MTQVNTQREHKSKLMIYLFSQKENLLSLYNGIRGSDYTNVEDLVVYTIDDVIYLGVKNDISFVFDHRLNLYEHQSSWNPNMPLRGLFYLASLYRKYVAEYQLDIYSETRLRLPAPQYVVFYNGTKEEPDRHELRLSDSFEVTGEEPAIECIATVININMGKNKELMERCQILYEYSYFIAEIRREREKGLTIHAAIDRAVSTCIENGILADFLRRHRAEMVDMILTGYADEIHRRAVEAKAREDGIAAGMEIGKQAGMEIGKQAGIQVGMQAGIQAGINKINELFARLIRDNRLDDLEKSLTDAQFQQQLLEEYGINEEEYR